MSKNMNLPSGWKFESTRKIYSNNYIELYEDIIDIKSRKKIYTRAKRKNYSTIVPFISDNEILVIKSYRHLVNSYQIEAPSGYIETGETPIAAAARELKEETGYKANNIISLDSYTLDYTMFEQRGNLFIAYDLVNERNQELGMMEIIEPMILTIDEIRKLLINGKILNASSIVAFYKSIDFHLNYKNKNTI
ncbi:MAG: NUDIX hydrolase [Thaumarchaeota archaeon]|nr:MAG: NUDIX hydrolase [Nitrososphaerota archaeon]